MKVLSSPASPFGRKVKVTAIMKGLSDQITFETTAADAPTTPIRWPKSRA